MKSLMYHYVRSYDKNYPFSNFLEKKVFEKQIKFFFNKGIISNQDDIFHSKKEYILTFDDGLKDHLEVAEKLKKNNCIGLFFIPSLPIMNNEILNVHKTHLILSKVGGKIALNKLQELLRLKKIKNYINSKEKNKFVNAYRLQNNEDETRAFKKIMNY